MHPVETVILASKSQIREKILESLALPFLVISSVANEEEITTIDPCERALKRASLKAISLAKNSSLSLIIGCDQVLSFSKKIFSKPKSQEEAFSHLKSLQGQKHTLFSAVSLYYAKTPGVFFEIESFVSSVEMPMKALTDEKIRYYVATGEWQGCVGGYRIEGRGGELFEPFPEDLDKTIIMGLPREELKKKLQLLGCDFSKEKKLPFQLKHLSI